jgi:hypothetical protein
MKWGLRLLGVFDILTFLLFIKPKLLFLSASFSFLPFSILQKTNALFEVILLLLFLTSGILLFLQKKSGLIFSFILIPFRFSFLYFSLDFLSHLAYFLSANQWIAPISFPPYWFYMLLLAEITRYALSVYWYYKLTKS